MLGPAIGPPLSGKVRDPPPICAPSEVRMRHRQLGRSGFTVPVLIFGNGAFGGGGANPAQACA